MLKLAFAIPGLILTAAIVWAFGQAPFFESGAKILANPWGIVTLIDLYAGFIFTGVIIAAIERWKAWAFGMLALAFVLGNVVFAVWAVARGASRLHEIARR